MSVASQAASSHDAHVVMPRSPSHLSISSSPRNRPSIAHRLRQPSHTWQKYEANPQQRHPQSALSRTRAMKFEYLPPGSRDFQDVLAALAGDISMHDFSQSSETSLENGAQDDNQHDAHEFASPATEPSLVTFEERQDIDDPMFAVKKNIRTYSRKDNKGTSSRRIQIDSSKDEAEDLSREDPGTRQLKGQRRDVKRTKRRLPMNHQLTMVPSLFTEEANADFDADNEHEHLTATSDPIEDTHAASEEATGAHGTSKVVTRRMTLGFVEKQFRPSRASRTTADRHAFKIPKAKNKSAMSRTGDGFSQSELSLPTKIKRQRRARRIAFQGTGTLRLVAGELPAPRPLELHRARQSCEPITTQPTQILLHRSDGLRNLPSTTDRSQPNPRVSSPAPSRHSRRLSMGSLGVPTRGFMAAPPSSQPQLEINDHPGLGSNHQHDDDVISTHSTALGSNSDDVVRAEGIEETYADLMGIVLEDQVASDTETMHPESAANGSKITDKIEDYEMLLETAGAPSHQSDSSRPGQKARMKSSGLWMEVHEDIEGTPVAARSRWSDGIPCSSQVEPHVIPRNSTSLARSARVEPSEQDLRNSDEALKVQQPNHQDSSHLGLTGAEEFPEAETLPGHVDHHKPSARSSPLQREHESRSLGLTTARRSRFTHSLVSPGHRRFIRDSDNGVQLTAYFSDNGRHEHEDEDNGSDPDLEGAIQPSSHDAWITPRSSTRNVGLSYSAIF
ncbi:hypothetical protein HDK90DRAFT_466174 [Phyllosticta capitalensis]|uniref:Uncharacterized protein n=1 Tax=Phyllosticta capitalensis TaxID=121624 RepID=A0ABR1YSC5_9PEZI